MKIPASVRLIYDSRKPVYEQLRIAVDKKVAAVKKEEWHYISRVKEVESFALKAESGRFDDISKLEDFFACTLVVPNFKHIKDVEDNVRSIFKFSHRRPKRDERTHKRPESFEFDDLRVYVRWEDDPVLPPTELNGLEFEIQIKTFLQHAWSIATHDLIYKSYEADWPKERIAFQIKAMLEHAESSIQQAEEMAKSSSIKKTDDITRQLSSIITLVGEIWEKDDLPRDRRRLAVNILQLLEGIRMDAEELKDILLKATVEGRGARTRNLSPFGVVLQSILDQNPEKIISHMKEGSSKRVFLPREIELPGKMESSQLKNIVRCG